MAIKGAIRWKPDVYRSSTNTTIAGLVLPAATSTDKPQGTIIMIAQAVTFDDIRFGPVNAYRPGHVESEIFVDVLFEQAIQKDISVFIGKSYAECEAIWDAELEAFKTWVTPHGTLLVNAIRPARRASFKLV